MQFLFNDLDPSDAVDFKKLLVELYDCKLISRSSLQLKMDLDPEIENANQENEQLNINLLDEKQIKPVVDMVIAGILDLDQAKQILGIRNNGQKTEANLKADAGNCGQCQWYNAGQCELNQISRSEDASGCRFFNQQVAV